MTADPLKLINADCLEVMGSIGKVDLVLADMPYGTTNCAWDSEIDLRDLWQKLPSVMKDNTPIVLLAQTPFDKVLGFSNLKGLRYEWVWEKTLPTGHLNANKMPMKAHENILVFYRKLPKYNPQKTSGHKRKTAVKRGDITPIYGEQKFYEIPYSSTDRYPRSVLRFPSDRQKSKLHPTQKPVALMEYLIKTYTDEGDTVLDFCMGSGTTGIACKNLNRKFIGIEKDKKYFDIASKRIAA